jgi:hypothetical protein
VNVVLGCRATEIGIDERSLIIDERILILGWIRPRRGSAQRRKRDVELGEAG